MSWEGPKRAGPGAGSAGPRLQPEKSCLDQRTSSCGSRSAAGGGPGHGAAGAGPELAMGGVTATTMRFEGAAPGWAARYRALSLVLAALLGQGKADAVGDHRVPRGLRGSQVAGREGSPVDEGSGSHREPPVVETANSGRSCEPLSCGWGSAAAAHPEALLPPGERSGRGGRGAWLPDSGSGLHPEFSMELHMLDLVQQRGSGRTPVSRGPFHSFEKPRTFRPTFIPSGGVGSIRRLWFPASPLTGSHFGPFPGAVGTRTLQVSGDLCKRADADLPGLSLLLRSLSRIITPLWVRLSAGEAEDPEPLASGTQSPGTPGCGRGALVRF